MYINDLIPFDATVGKYPDIRNERILRNMEVITSLLHEVKISNTIKNITATPPFRRVGDTMIFHAFSTNRTAYATIRRLEKVFTYWYLQTETLPIIVPMPMNYYYEPKMIPYYILKRIRERGIKVYKNANSE